MLSVAETLSAAADLIEPEGKWTQGWSARTALGRPCHTKDPEAACFCMVGAVAKAGGAETYISKAWRFISDHFPGKDPGTPVKWNDKRQRTQAEVVAKLRKLSALAKEQGK